MRAKIFLQLLFIGLLSSCGVTKFIPEDERLYTGAELEVKTNDSEGVNNKALKIIHTRLEDVIQPDPNGKFLGMRIGLWAYYKGSKEKPGFINRFLKKKIGQEPVYFSQVNPSKTEELLLNRLENNGFFYSLSSSESTGKGKFAGVEYMVEVSRPYRLEKYQLEGDSLTIQKEIAKIIEETELKPGVRFELDAFKSERLRLNDELKKRGFYNFNADYLIFEADTNNYDERKFDLFLRLKQDVAEKSIVPYEVKDIRVYPNYSVDEEKGNQDTTTIQDIDFIQDELAFRPELLEKYILIKEEEAYSSELSRLTTNRLSSIGNYRYVNLRYVEKDSIGTQGPWGLDANIYLSPLKKRSLRAELQGLSKSNNFIGPAVLLTYRNRNIFKGGETFNISAQFGYETQIAGGDRTGLSTYDIGLKSDLIFPRVIFPVNIEERFSYSVPKTKISLGGESLNRIGLYRSNSATISYGYYWNANRFVYHEINPISLSVVSLSDTSPEFEEILDDNPFLRRSFEQQFIAGLNYTFNYNQLGDQFRKHKIFAGTTVDVAGNLLNLMDNTFGKGESGKVFGMEYAQYARGDLDFRYHIKLGEENVLATRVFGGIGIPFGNSVSLPYVKQYSAGGPNSVRAFRIRSLGPGTYQPDSINNQSYFDQTGDIRIEGNIEYRFPIVSYLKGALFMDAGNVWLMNDNEALPGGKFTSSWLRELGVGAGFGLRIDIEFFVIRFDFAAPIRKPFLPEGERWLKEFKVFDRDWRRENLIFNFAIGYPF
ncbi:BamA/TamA family outer membrane protein [Echinicola sp. CAU 1574]|uniref:BamA/TamA family outer membrane protein n=1 Tax=Echinicola arenosa TaxID=2774144 RepID=A0ABR9AH12_9BACT|nr:BamA/TamA family outer membrane protein [Echinicola arenosa]MBD8487566.1 BamA/TamA family outer membrane protein [Echinicola arenosa]